MVTAEEMTSSLIEIIATIGDGIRIGNAASSSTVMTRATAAGMDAGRAGLAVSGETAISFRAAQTWDIDVIARTITGGVAT